MDAAESMSTARSIVAGLGVGLYADYSAAHLMYLKRGYLPGGSGIAYEFNPVVPGATVRVDDDLNLMMTRVLKAQPDRHYRPARKLVDSKRPVKLQGLTRQALPAAPRPSTCDDTSQRERLRGEPLVGWAHSGVRPGAPARWRPRLATAKPTLRRQEVAVLGLTA
jgi:hypothetical protein